MQPSQKKKIVFFIARNLAVYLLLIALIYVESLFTKMDPGYAPAFYMMITCFYVWILIHNVVLFEKLLLRKKYLSYTLLFIAGFMLSAYCDRIIMKPVLKKEGGMAGIIFANFFYTVIGLIFNLAYKYMVERKNRFQLNIMQRDIELQQLKAHLNPHFLFNALNNIYSYTLQQNRYGGELILKLGELMRFILDCSDKSHIKLTDELKFITNYIVFEKERLGERCNIHFNLAGETGEQQIAPLILFPFIENACKYGADTIQKTEIDISIENLPGSLKMTVKNNIVNRTSPSTKTGLLNAIRRLELLYPNKHEVLITTDENKFGVELILQLP